MRRQSWRLPVAGGASISGIEAGDGASTIALLHGGASNRRWWDPVAERLISTYRVTWWDHRGHGLSGSTGGECSVVQLAEDTIAVLEARELVDVVLVGHSLGATVALTAAGAASDRVVGVACVEGGVYDPRQLFGTTWEQARREMCASRAPATPAVLEAWLAGADLAPSALDAVQANFIETDSRRLALRVSQEHEEHLAYSLWAQDLPSLLSTVSVPVAVIAAEGGDEHTTRVRRECVSRAHGLVAGPLIEEWIWGNHHLPLQRPDAVAAAIDRLCLACEETSCGRV